MRFSVPKNIDFEQMEEQFQLRKEIKHYKRDKLAYIMHLLNYYQLTYSKYQSNGVFIPLNAKILQKQLGNYYTQYFKMLFHMGILECNHEYNPGFSSYKYRLSQPYAFTERNYELTDFSFQKKLRTYYEKSYKDVKKKYPFLIKWFDGLEIDEPLALEFIEKDFQLKMTYPELRDKDKHGFKCPEIQKKTAIKSVEKIKFKEFQSFVIDTKGYRFHSILTQMRSSLRHALTYKGQKLVSLDIKNSQPYFSTILLSQDFWKNAKTHKKYKNLYKSINNNTNYYSSIMFSTIQEILDRPDVQRYVNLVQNGELYHEFIKEYEKRYGSWLDHKSIKLELFTVFFSNNYTSNNSKALFKELFPTIDELLRKIKFNNYKDLSWLLQRVESEMVLDVICQQFNEIYPNIPMFTIHDSIITTVQNVMLLKQFMQNAFMNQFGHSPKLKEECWDKQVLNDNIKAMSSKLMKNVA